MQTDSSCAHIRALLLFEKILKNVCLKDTLKPEKMLLKQKNFLIDET